MSNSSTSSSRYLAALGAAIALPLAAFVAAAGLTVGAPPEGSGQYWAAYWVKYKEKAAAELTGERILIFGSSSAFFGVQPRVIEAALGRPTANLGVHGGSGYAFTLAQIEQTARAGDVVVLTLDLSTLLLDQHVTEFGAEVSYAIDNRLLTHRPVGDRFEALRRLDVEDVFWAIGNAGAAWTARRGHYWDLPVDPHGYIRADPDEQAFKRALRQRRRYGPDYLMDLYREHGREASFSMRLSGALRRMAAAVEARGARFYFAPAPSVYAIRGPVRADFLRLTDPWLITPPNALRVPFESAFDNVSHADSAAAAHLSAVLARSLCDVAIRDGWGRCPDARRRALTRHIAAFEALPPLRQMRDIGPVAWSGGPGEAPALRRMRGSEASFSVFASRSCANALIIEARPAAVGVRSLAVEVDGAPAGRFALAPDVFTQIRVPLPADDEMRSIRLNAQGAAAPDRDPGPSLLLRRLSVRAACGPAQDETEPAAAP